MTALLVALVPDDLALVRAWQQARAVSGATGTAERYGAYVRALARGHPGRALLDLGTEELRTWLSGRSDSRSVATAVRSFYAYAEAVGLLDQSPAAALEHGIPGPVAFDVQGTRTSALDVAGWRKALAGQGVPATTIRTMTYYVQRLARERANRRIRDLTTQELLEWFGEKSWTPGTRKSARSALRSFYGWLVDCGTILITAALGHEATTHTLRHRAATVAYRGTRDLRAVQELLGHSRPETTAGYVAIEDEAIRAAMLEAAR